MSAPTSFGRLHLAPYLAPFLDRYPEVRLQLDLSDSFEDLVASRIDLAVRIASEAPAGLTAHRLAPSPRVLCAAPAYLAAHGAPETIDALADHRLLAADGQMPWRLAGPEGPHEVDRPSAVGTNSSEVVRELALAGVGIAVRSIWDFGRELSDRRLVRVLPGWRGSSEAAIYAVHVPGPLPRAAAAMLDHLRALFADESGVMR
jgi:DNA-binding transcriptional LysR family regulator